jgi:branched-chain amino acid transport system ATP-binding protein
VTVILEAKNLTKSYGGVRVVDDLSVSLLEGEALGIVGPNGAGKTTMINLLTGIVRLDSGTVVFAGQDISGRSTDERCHLGLGRTYQIPKPFEGMTVFENVLVGGTYGRSRSEKASYEICARALQRTSLLPQANVLGESSACWNANVSSLRARLPRSQRCCLDEIAGGLTEHEVQPAHRHHQAVAVGGSPSS